MRYGVAFWLTRPDGAVLLRRRPEKGLLGGMIEIPSTPWRAEPWSIAEAIGLAPAATALVGAAGHRHATASPIFGSNWRYSLGRAMRRGYGAGSTGSASMRCRP